jgi:hypothetical protein
MNGGQSMIELFFHHDYTKLPRKTDRVIPVQLYGLDGKKRGDISYIGNSLPQSIQNLGRMVPKRAMDFLSIAMAVTAADTFVHRNESPDGWTREFSINLPLCEPQYWTKVKKKLENTLHFLSGDIWSFNFSPDGYQPPPPIKHKNKRIEKIYKLLGLDCVCLFSGGLDSAIGVIDLISEGYKPLLLSHAYKSDKLHQDKIKTHFSGRFEAYQFNADPHSCNGPNEITMRTRSFNFIAFGIVCGSILRILNKQSKIDFIMPENGFISLNAPLTIRRIGSLSTRTTHYHFIRSIQEILNEVDIPVSIRNPYKFKTKGEMLLGCKNQQLLKNIVSDTVSCSHWKRKNKQCGICVPCLIRRASLFKGKIQETSNYQINNISDVLSDAKDEMIYTQLRWQFLNYLQEI